jgi:hypothetical protein
VPLVAPQKIFKILAWLALTLRETNGSSIRRFGQTTKNPEG